MTTKNCRFSWEKKLLSCKICIKMWPPSFKIGFYQKCYCKLHASLKLFKLHDCFNLKTLKSFDPFLKTETGTMAFEKRGRFILFPTYQSFDPFFSDWPSWLHQLVLLLMTYFSFVSFLARWDFSFLDCSRGGKARRKVHFQKINQGNEKLSKEACHFLIHQS